MSIVVGSERITSDLASPQLSLRSAEFVNAKFAKMQVRQAKHVIASVA